MRPPLQVGQCRNEDTRAIFEIINESAQAYRGVIPPDHWHEPYMPMPELEREIERGVRFFGCRVGDELVGVMGIEDVKDVTLIRHAYVRSEYRRHGIGALLLSTLHRQTDRPVLIGTWAAATWAIAFYQKHGFVLIPQRATIDVLNRYWPRVPSDQKVVSVVLAEEKWRGTHGEA